MELVRCAVVGLGTFGSFHARVWSELPHTELAAVCDLDEARAKAFGLHYGVPWFTDHRALLTQCSCDAVSVATPDHLHRQVAVDAALAGKHLLIEKPLATSREDVKAILQAVRKAGVRVQCDLHNRVNPPFALAKQRIQAGELGKVRSMYIRMNDACSVAKKMLTWTQNSSILWFAGVHSLDLACFLSGSRPQTVYTMATRGVLDSMGIPAVDLFQTAIEMENGVIVQMENGWIIPDGNPSLIDLKCTVQCERGMVKINGSDNDLIRVYTSERMETPSCIARPEIRGRVMGFAVENLSAFARALQDQAPFNSTLQEAADVCAALDAIHESARLHRPITVQYEAI